MDEHVEDAPQSGVQRRARYGVVYLRALAAQAGCLFHEISSGEDVLATDANIEYSANIVRVQVKSTKKFAIDGRNVNLTYTARKDWIRKWRKSKVPVYFVVVVVPTDSGDWLTHDEHGTLMARTAAYWCRIDVDAVEASMNIAVPRAQRLTVETLSRWQQDLLDDFSPKEES